MQMLEPDPPAPSPGPAGPPAVRGAVHESAKPFVLMWCLGTLAKGSQGAGSRRKLVSSQAFRVTPTCCKQGRQGGVSCRVEGGSPSFSAVRTAALTSLSVSRTPCHAHRVCPFLSSSFSPPQGFLVLERNGNFFSLGIPLLSRLLSGR